jgi:hypothetical protein
MLGASTLAPDLLKFKIERGVPVFKKVLVLTICLLTTSSAFANSPNLRYTDKQRTYVYRALTYIATAEVPPPVSKTMALHHLKNNPSEVLAELCYYAGALQWRLNNLFSLHPQASQTINPLRTQIQTLIENGQQTLRAACAVTAENNKLPILQKITIVQNAIADVTSEAINLRNTVSYRH